ncbi:hypothetical protein AVEN_51432-1 [Araneus ventricosus]|uniref:Uncharacterized protein n=1 Tax=Araneus ventricosus TaxID=182803 RepID=A0A4Y2GNR0_ARAVE|nr:hypothetical protein AVEN_51432-1 [Araneus ventricosus]
MYLKAIRITDGNLIFTDQRQITCCSGRTARDHTKAGGDVVARVRAPRGICPGPRLPEGPQPPHGGAQGGVRRAHHRTQEAENGRRGHHRRC